MINKEQLTECDKEPIHIPGKIQGHGFLISCLPSDFRISGISKNISKFIDIDFKKAINLNLENLLEEDILILLRAHVAQKNLSDINPLKVRFKDNLNKEFYMISHFSQDHLILEFEPTFNNNENEIHQFYNSIKNIIKKIHQSSNIEELYNVVVNEIKNYTSYDRVMLYRFDETTWDGEVVAEAKETHIESYLNLRYPATDIPVQARQLYLKNHVRIITDINVPASEVILTEDHNNQPLDMTCCVLRGISPIHIEYLGNMGVTATLTISVVIDNKLWGLISCHNYSPKFVDYNIRSNCEIIGRIFSNCLNFKISSNNAQYQAFLKNNELSVINLMSKNGISEGLTKFSINMLDLNSSTGGAVINGDEIKIVGNVPSTNDILKIINWLEYNCDDIFHTDNLSSYIHEAIEFKDIASGLLALCISKDPKRYVLWFKPEVITTVDWGYKPEKQMKVINDKVILSPQKSFKKWSEKVENKSECWTEIELTIARSLKSEVIQIVISNLNKIEVLMKELENKNNELRNFAHVASHDLQEPLRTISSFAALLEKKTKDKLNDREKDYINFIIDGSTRMQKLIRSLLEFTKVGVKHKPTKVDLNDVLKDTLSNLSLLIEDNKAEISHKYLPSVTGDKDQLNQLFQNIISNGIKYNKSDKPTIEISFKENNDHLYTFLIKDNGIGIEKKFHNEVFEPFRRLHTQREYEGTGIGMATCKKIIELHKGKIWVESELDQGSTFYFTLPF